MPFKQGAWDRQTDGRADGSQHWSVPPMDEVAVIKGRCRRRHMASCRTTPWKQRGLIGSLTDAGLPGPTPALAVRLRGATDRRPAYKLRRAGRLMTPVRRRSAWCTVVDGVSSPSPCWSGLRTTLTRNNHQRHYFINEYNLGRLRFFSGIRAMHNDALLDCVNNLVSYSQC